MTQPIKYDAFSSEIPITSYKFYAVLLEDVLLETLDDDIEHEYKRGIYAFRQIKARNRFTMRCNSDKSDLVAYRFNRKL